MFDGVEAQEAEVKTARPYPPLTKSRLRRVAAKMCWGKTGYSSKREAKTRGRHMMRAGFEPSIAYHCPFCSRWHLSCHREKGDREFFDRLREAVATSLTGEGSLTNTERRRRKQVMLRPNELGGFGCPLLCVPCSE